MTDQLLVENGPWRNLKEVLQPSSVSAISAERALVRFNQPLRKKLGLRSDPIEFQNSEGNIQVRVRGIAGTLSIDDFILEIAPKFVPSGEVSERWDGALLALVRYALPKHVSFQRSTNLDVTRHGVLDLLAMSFIDAVSQGLRDQLIQTYQSREIQSPVVRGRLSLTRQIRSFVTRPHLVECDVDQLDVLNPYNDLLKWALSVLARGVKSAALRRRLVELDRRVPGTPNRSLAIRQRVVTPPYQFRGWSNALEIASLLSAGSVHAPSFGAHTGYSFVFNMEKLFEHFVAESLKRASLLHQLSGLHAQPQVSTQYATPITAGARPFFSKPDNLLVGFDGIARCIVDAKYKRLSDATGERDRKPQNQDVYELVAAMTAQKCPVGLLLYPRIEGDVELADRTLRRWQIDAFGQPLMVAAFGLDLMSLGSAEGARSIEFDIATHLSSLVAPAAISA